MTRDLIYDWWTDIMTVVDACRPYYNDSDCLFEQALGSMLEAPE